MLLERLLDNLALEVEVFALCRVAPGWRLRLPALDWVTFHCVLQGRGEAGAAGAGDQRVAPGFLVLVPPRLDHRLQSGAPPHAEGAAGDDQRPWSGLAEYLAGPDEEPGMVVVCGRAQVLYGGSVGVFDRLSETLVLDFADDRQVMTLFDAMLNEVRFPGPGARAMVSALMDELVIHAFRRLGREGAGSMPWLDALEDPGLGNALDAMLADPGGPHTVATLADRCHMSRSAFARRFREAFGVPPIEYLREIRLRVAARMLEKDPPPSVDQVARRVGFGSRSQFSRAFKDRFDTPPSGFGRRQSSELAPSSPPPYSPA